MKEFQILLADDDEDDRSLFMEAVSKAGSNLRLVTKEDGQQLMDYLDEVKQPPPPDVIFLDINMPCKTGGECLREIRSHEKFRDVPIIMFSTSSRQADIDDCYVNGANLYISKSVFFEDEVANIKEVLSTNWKEYLPTPDPGKFVF